MSKILTILGLAGFGLLASGCATMTDNGTDTAADRPIMPATAPVYAPSASAALAFDPPVALGRPLPSFSRDGRGPEAFAGYEEQITTLSYTHQRDEIRVFNDSGLLERRAYTDRTSVTTR